MAKKRPAQAVTPGAQSKRAEDELQVQSATQQVATEPISVAPVVKPKVATQAIPSSTTNEVPARSGFRLTLPPWPNSKRGPQSTPPPPGMRSMNPLRSEQLAEVGYNQETGESSEDSSSHSLADQNQGTLSIDQSENAQDIVRTPKKERL